MKYLIGLAIAAFMLAVSTLGASAQGWNAVAVDFAGATGVVFGADTEEAAKADALSQCGANCQSIMQTQAACMAVAYTAEDGGYYGYAQGNTKDGSSTIALGYCIDGSTSGCEVIFTQCLADTPVTSTPGPKTKTKG